MTRRNSLLNMLASVTSTRLVRRDDKDRLERHGGPLGELNQRVEIATDDIEKKLIEQRNIT